MAWPAQGNDHRQAEASQRDAEVAARLWTSVPLNPREARVVQARMSTPGASWSVIAEQLGMTKHTVTGVWRRLLHRTGQASR